MEAAAGAAAEPAAWAAEPFAEPEPGSEELEAGGALDRVLRESVCQQQGWVRVYGEGRRGGERRKTSRPQLLSPFLFFPAAEAPDSPRLLASPLPGPFPEPRGSPCATPSLLPRCGMLRCWDPRPKLLCAPSPRMCARDAAAGRAERSRI